MRLCEQIVLFRRQPLAEGREPHKEVHRVLAIILCSPQPYSDALSTVVDVAHDLYLGTAFVQIILIDAQLIDP